MKRHFISELSPTDRLVKISIPEEKVERMAQLEVSDGVHTIMVYLSDMSVKRLVGCLKELK